jgi:hypothetical protein
MYTRPHSFSAGEIVIEFTLKLPLPLGQCHVTFEISRCNDIARPCRGSQMSAGLFSGHCNTASTFEGRGRHDEYGVFL